MKVTYYKEIVFDDLSPSQAALIINILESDDKHVSLYNYNTRTVKALLDKGILTILKRRKFGPDIGPVLRLRKGSESQNKHLLRL